jgi:predicted transcriptional regulator of viral defense system
MAIYARLVETDGPKLLTPADAMEAVAGTVAANSLSHTLSSLESKGLLRRIGKGVYLNKSTRYAPKMVDVIPWVFKHSKYYLGLNAVANHWGLSPQIPYSYQVVYLPKDEAQTRRVTRWCLMLKEAEKDVGGILTPVVGRTGSTIGRGVSQAILDGSQLPISTIERTIIDSVVYTKEIGGAGEALRWIKAALSKPIDYDEFDRIMREVYRQINSAAARLGLLLETLLSERPAQGEQKASIDTLLTRLQRVMVGTRATYNWGPEKTKTEYFERWRLHVSSSYVNQLREISSFE